MREIDATTTDRPDLTTDHVAPQSLSVTLRMVVGVGA